MNENSNTNENQEQPRKIIVSGYHKDHNQFFDDSIFLDIEFPTCPCIGDKITIDNTYGKCSYRVIDREFNLYGIDNLYEFMILILEEA